MSRHSFTHDVVPHAENLNVIKVLDVVLFEDTTQSAFQRDESHCCLPFYSRKDRGDLVNGRKVAGEIEPFLVIETGLLDRLADTDGIPDLLGFFRHEGVEEERHNAQAVPDSIENGFDARISLLSELPGRF